MFWTVLICASDKIYKEKYRPFSSCLLIWLVYIWDSVELFTVGNCQSYFPATVALCVNFEWFQSDFPWLEYFDLFTFDSELVLELPPFDWSDYFIDWLLNSMFSYCRKFFPLDSIVLYAFGDRILFQLAVNTTCCCGKKIIHFRIDIILQM